MSGFSTVSDEPDITELLELFKPFDIRLNPEKYQLEYPKELLRRASVLIPLQLKNGEYHVLLTVRSKNLTHHSGLVAFPGGIHDESDIDDIHTALREADEEIGLKAADVKVIGIFSPGLTRPNTIVYPVLGVVSDNFVAAANPNEVSLVFSLPLKRFLSDKRRSISNYNSLSEGVYHVHHFTDTVDGQEVDTFGFTAIYCVMVALRVYRSDKTFCFHNDVLITKDSVFAVESVKQLLSRFPKLVGKI